MTDQSISEPISAFSAAKGFKEAAKVILLSEHSGHGTQVRFFPSIHMLLGFSTELFLKAFLLEKGLSQDKLKKNPYGHNLDYLLAKSKELGFPADAGVDTIVAHINPGHSNYEYRYFGPKSEFNGTNYEVAFMHLDRLDVLVDQIVGASARFGLQPGH